jgi:hypothetical protein
MGEARAKKAEELPDDTDDSLVCVVRKVKPPNGKICGPTNWQLTAGIGA